jgi:hypothetical protein
MSSNHNFDDRIRPGMVLRTYANDRAVTYRADRVDRKAKLVEGAMLDDRGSVITGFMMTFEAWRNTVERSRT